MLRKAFTDQEVKTVAYEIRLSANHETRLHQQENFEVIQFLDNSALVRRLA